MVVQETRLEAFLGSLEKPKAFQPYLRQEERRSLNREVGDEFKAFDAWVYAVGSMAGRASDGIAANSHSYHCGGFIYNFLEIYSHQKPYFKLLY